MRTFARLVQMSEVLETVTLYIGRMACVQVSRDKALLLIMTSSR